MMFGFKAHSKSQDVLNALSRSLAIIEFDPQGTILDANPNFCKTMGYELSEIQGKHHRIFVDPKNANSPQYQQFWAALGRGEFDAGQYKRIAKGGRDVWLEASYNPVFDKDGKVVKVIKLATDITFDRLKNAEFEGRMTAVSRVQAIIEFTVTGDIITANQNFLDLIGYSLEEIQGRNHSMFVDPAYVQSNDYSEFWKTLNLGQFVSGSFKRIGKGGKEVWIQASYNPIFDLDGKVMKVVKFASDITDLTQIGEGLARLASNKIDQRIEKAFTPTFEKLREDFNIAHDHLNATLREVAELSGGIQSGAHQITMSADDLARRTETQAANLEETAAALDSITVTVKKSADGASHAREVVLAADTDARKSATVVRQAVQAMDAIAKSADQITQIIGVIDEIAFQTNLLALNAGVEAARAGEAGRGFAVVASEVRALAQRSAEAAKEIKGLISTSTTQVDAGVKLVAETGKSLERIMAQVADINGVMAEIATGSQEQSQGIAEVNIAITQMDQVTQNNAAMVEETTAASHTLSQEAERLDQLIAQFQLGRMDKAGAGRRDNHAPPKSARPVPAVNVRDKREARVAPVARARQAVEMAAADDWQEF